MEILRVHVDGELVLKDHHVDSTKWSPLIYSFRHYYRLAENELGKTFGARV